MLSKFTTPFIEAPEAESIDLISFISPLVDLITDLISTKTNSIVAVKSVEGTPLSSSSTNANPADDAVISYKIFLGLPETFSSSSRARIRILA